MATGQANDASTWRFRRALARVEPTIEPLLARHATEYWGRPLRRKELCDGTGDVAVRGVRWSIDADPVVELRVGARGPSALTVFDFSLVAALRKAIRTRHVEVRTATGLDFARRG